MLSKRLLPTTLALALAACGGITEPETTRSNQQRLTPQVNPSQLSAAVRANSDFAFDFYRHVAGERGNIVFSPHSISSAFAMLWAGARTTSDAAIKDALHFPFAQAEQHPLLNALDAELEKRNATDRVTLSVVNDVWAQKGFTILPEFLDTLAGNYGAGVRRLDFLQDPETARAKINDWVSAKTNDRIPELFGKGSIDSATALVLTNAVYFKADWKDAFDPSHTTKDAFHLDASSDVSVPFMHRTARAGHAAKTEWQAVELPYVGDELALLVIVPTDLAAFEASIDGAGLESITAALKYDEVRLALPKFTHEKPYDLKPTLTAMGMGELFGSADLSGIDGEHDLFVQSAVHKAFIEVSEEGTEAAAATGIAVGVTSVPAEPLSITVDRPFIYVLRDTKTNAVLFLGRVVDPR